MHQDSSAKHVVRLGIQQTSVFQLRDLLMGKGLNGSPISMLTHGSNEVTSGWLMDS